VAFGAGASMVDRAVDAVFGPRTIRSEKVVTGSPAPAPAPNAKSLSSDACDIHSKAFQDVCFFFLFM
jgi:coiled-coil-helix-coiled-coil-helix domain-containing protein 10